MGTRLNAFLAAVPGNGAPSPNAQELKARAAATNRKMLPALAIPERDDDNDNDKEQEQEQCPDDENMASVEDGNASGEPMTPHPFRYRNQYPATPTGPKVRALAQIFDHQKMLSASNTTLTKSSGLSLDFLPPSNQDDIETKGCVQAATPAKHRSVTSAKTLPAPQEPTDITESSPLKRLSLLQQQQLQIQLPHARRVSNTTAVYSKMLQKRPGLDITPDVIKHFAQIPVPTLSRSFVRQTDDNQHDDEASSVPAMALVGHDPAITIDPMDLLAVCKRGELIPVASALQLIAQATEILRTEPNVVSICAPLTMVGDLHGQFRDLVALLDEHGVPAVDNRFLFLGDYVDRGLASCEILLLLLAFKVALPSAVYLLRGNHECRSLSTYYGFRAECLQKYGRIVYTRVIKCFECLPLAATIETRDGPVLAVHGGLSPSIQRVADINADVDRFVEPEPSGALCDLLWADPARKAQSEDWTSNTVRGCSFTFSESACREFLSNNGLLSIVRAHELEEDGFRQHFISDTTDPGVWPPVVTVFSAPEYCNLNHNLGATLLLPYDHEDNAPPFEIRQHLRSNPREEAYAGPSEDAAVISFLQAHLPFLPTDFYELVALCRDLSKSLEVAGTVATPVASSASNVLCSSSSNVLHVADGVSEDTASTQLEHPTIPNVDAVLAATMQATNAMPSPTASPSFVALETHVNAKTKRKSKSMSSWWSDIVGAFSNCFRQDACDARARAAQYALPRSCTASQLCLPSTTVVQQRRHSQAAQRAVTKTKAKALMPSQKGIDVFSPLQWTALRLAFSMLDIDGSGMLREESFIVLLAEQDEDAYATRDELETLVSIVDGNGDGHVTEQGFIEFAYRAYLRATNSMQS